MVASNISKRTQAANTLQQSAAALGVSKSHLSRVMAGKRESRSLLARYGKLIKTEHTSTNSKS